MLFNRLNIARPMWKRRSASIWVLDLILQHWWGWGHVAIEQSFTNESFTDSATRSCGHANKVYAYSSRAVFCSAFQVSETNQTFCVFFIDKNQLLFTMIHSLYLMISLTLIVCFSIQ